MTNDTGTMYATWTDPEGTVWPLTDISPERGYFTRPDIAGWGAPPFEYVTDPMSRGGDNVRFIRAQPARITWPLHVYGETYVEYNTRRRALRRAFLMTARRSQPGTLTVSLPDGTARSVQAYYEDGWGGDTGDNRLSSNPVLTLFCPDGAWQDVEPLTLTRAAGSEVSFYSPFLTITSSLVLGDSLMTNPGELTAWPTWTINGPMTQLTATNATTGQAFTLTHTLTTGQTATITTDRPTVRGNSGQNLVGSLDWPTAYLWGLESGVNQINFTVTGSGTTTSINITFYPRYDGL